ncbi:putative acylesterase/phospholipase RssA [Bradyrhizobium sp. AZCC 1588]|uniref:patatin-like phospholipase family protein n=1 Tax=unclassified Bradyrhizobium TaxID=2631580 RepID=UPI002FF0E9E3
MNDSYTAKKRYRNTPHDIFPWTIELALSGGGLRATAFGLGVMLYLVHSGLNKKVRNIASVSGGSITNAFVAGRCDFATVDIDRFRSDVAAELARLVASHGLLNARPTWIYIVAILATVALLLYLTVLHFLSVPWVVTAIMLLLLLYGRGVVITAWMKRTFFPDGLDKLTLGDIAGHSVDHVFCSTDLNEGQPVFFSTASGGRTYSESYGIVNQPQVPVLAAVRASAAFPPLIPPILFKPNAEWTSLRGFDFQTGLFPQALWLTDGGAYNNFGTDWQRLRNHVYFDAALSPDDIRASSSGIDDAAMRAKVDSHYRSHGERYGQVQLVADASQKGRPKQLLSLHSPVIGMLTYMKRTMDVMYGSTLDARSAEAIRIAHTRMHQYPAKWYPNSALAEGDQLYQHGIDHDFNMSGPLIVIAPLSKAPLGILLEWGTSAFANAPEEIEKHGIVYRAELERAQQDFGDIWEVGAVKTTFFSLGRGDTLRLIFRGYVTARVVLTAAFAPYVPIPLPDRLWFEELIAP